MSEQAIVVVQLCPEDRARIDQLISAVERGVLEGRGHAQATVSGLLSLKGAGPELPVAPSSALS